MLKSLTLNRRDLLQWLPLLLFGLVMLTDYRTAVLSSVQRVLLATGLWKAEVPAAALAAPAGSSGLASYPNNLALVTLEGKSVHLSDLRGKVVFVNLWASWCPPCVAEMPGIHALYQKMDPRKVAFVMISLDADPAKAQALLKRQGYAFPVYFPTGDLPAPFNSSSIPSTVVLRPNGQVATRHDGMAEYDTPEFKRALEQLALP
jgi:thiol-disulfide isomerase/thioredoxin